MLVAATFFTEEDAFLRALLLAVACALILVSHLVFKPFTDTRTHNTETASLLILVVIAMVQARSALYSSR